MKKPLVTKTFWVALLSLGVCVAQPSSINLQVGPPPPVSAASGVALGVTGGSTIFYWIVVRYPAGASTSFGPVTVRNTVGVPNLSASSSVLVSWTGMPGATGYDVIRNGVNVNPMPCAVAVACTVALNQTATSFTDTGGATAAYPPAGLVFPSAFNAAFTLDNIDFTVPRVILNSDLQANVFWGSGAGLTGIPAAGIVAAGNTGDVQMKAPGGGLAASSENCTAGAGGNCSFGGTVTVSTSLLPNSRIDVRTQGAKCDGATNDSTAFQASITLAEAVGGAVYFPATANGCIAFGLTINGAMEMFSDGYSGYSNIGTSTYFPSGRLINTSTTADVIQIVLPAGNVVSAVTLRDFTIVGNGAVGGATTGSNINIVGGISSTAVRNLSFRNLLLRSAKEHGLRIKGNVFESEFVNVMLFANTGSGIYTEAASDATAPATLKLLGVSSQLNAYGANFTALGSGIRDLGGYYAANTTGGVLQTNGTLDFVATRFESNTGNQLAVSGGTGSITACLFSGNNVSTNGLNLSGVSATGEVVNANKWSGHTNKDVNIAVTYGGNARVYQQTSSFTIADALSGSTFRYDLWGAQDGRLAIPAGQILGWSDANFLRGAANEIDVAPGVTYFGTNSQFTKRIYADGLLPTIVSGFGNVGTPTIEGKPVAGRVTVGTGGDTTGLIDFNTGGWIRPPNCMVQNITAGTYLQASTTTSRMTINGTMAQSAVVSWICIGY